MNLENEKSLAISRAKIFKALGHPTRMFIVNYLSNKEAIVGELVDVVNADISTVSRHLSILKDAGILISRKEGNKSFYTVSCTCIMEFISCIDDVIINDAQSNLNCFIK